MTALPGFLKALQFHLRSGQYDTGASTVILSRKIFPEQDILWPQDDFKKILDGIRHAAIRKDTPLFVYCYSGARSSKAASALREMGYTRVKNIGGICSYLGKVERGSNRQACWHGAC